MRRSSHRALTDQNIFQYFNGLKMHIRLTPAQLSFQDELRDFYTNSVLKDWRNKYPDFESLGHYLREWEYTLDKGGWAVPGWPKEWGGRGADAVERAIFTELSAAFDAPEGINRLGKRLVAPVLMRNGTPEQQKHIAKIKTSEEVWCQGFSEPGAGSDLLSLRTSARLEGDEWVVNGQKIWTSFAQFAEWIILLVRTGEPGSGAAGISILLVELNSPGITIRPIQTISGRSEFNEVYFDNVRVPASHLVGEVNKGWPIVREVLQDERGADFNLARFSDLRRIFEQQTALERDKPKGSRHDRTVGAEYARIYAIQLFAMDLLRREQNGTMPAALESLLKLYTTETWRRFGDHQLLSFGPEIYRQGGFESLVDYYESRHYTISAGTSEIQRNTISNRLLGLPSARKKAGANALESVQDDWLGKDGRDEMEGIMLDELDKLLDKIGGGALGVDETVTGAQAHARLAEIQQQGWYELVSGESASTSLYAEAIKRLHRRAVPVQAPVFEVFAAMRLLHLADDAAARQLLAEVQAGERHLVLNFASLFAPDNVGSGCVPHADTLPSLAVVAEGDGLTLHLVEPGDAARERAPLVDPTLPAFFVTGTGRRVASLPQEKWQAAVAEVLVAQANAAVGQAQALFNSTIEHLKLREQFGVPVGSFQALQHRAADIACELYAAQQLSIHIAESFEGRDDRMLLGLLGKSLCGRAAVKASSEAVQLRGGMGFTWEDGAHFGLKRIMSLALTGPSVEDVEGELGAMVIENGCPTWAGGLDNA
ncbi:acyl-CoA dehydrogenase family protein [Achromobacter aloeverae]